MEANVKVIVKVRPPLDTPREHLCWKVSPHSGEITQIKTKTTKDEMMQPMAIQRNLETFSFGSSPP